ncbi:uncharacterized protein VTP21DRAFT_8573 [Calcarisporiella thermophila]|uniref:uncharacterized protein n=1 Tax=Calcarisporiella thermophila TaxID=911321 RepID=UPI003743069E
MAAVSSVDNVEKYYDSDPQLEWDRLAVYPTEFHVTLRVLRDSLPPAPARIADIGGGPGRYSLELTRRGYDVTLLDLSSANLKLAKEKAAELKVELKEVIHGNALDLPFADSSFDAVLLLGPLYHFHSREQRVKCLRETLRVVKPGGLIVAAWINRFSVFRDFAKRDPESLLQNPSFLDVASSHGKYDPAMLGDFFCDAYFAHPDEIVPECDEAGLEVVERVGVEGVVSRNDEKVNQLKGESWEKWVDINYRLGREPSMLGASDHIVAVCRKKPE